MLQRALTEARGGRRSMDVVETNAPEVEALAREQAVAEFDSPHLADLPAWAIPAASALVQRPRQSLGHRLQHRQGEARGTARDDRRLRRSEMEGPALARGDRQRLDVRRHRVSWARSAAASSSASSRRSSPRCAKATSWWRSSLAAGELPVCLTIYSGNADSIKAEGRADRLGRGRAAGRAPAGDRAGEERAASPRRAVVRRLRAVAGGPEAARPTWAACRRAGRRRRCSIGTNT